MAAALLGQGSKEEGLLQLEKALELDSTLYNAWANKGTLYKLKGDLKTAETCLRRALVLDVAQWPAPPATIPSLAALVRTRLCLRAAGYTKGVNVISAP